MILVSCLSRSHRLKIDFRNKTRGGGGGGSHVLHMLILGKHEKFLSETTMPRGLIFGMWHYLVASTSFVKSMPRGPKMGMPRESHVLHRLI